MMEMRKPLMYALSHFDIARNYSVPAGGREPIKPRNIALFNEILVSGCRLVIGGAFD